MALNRNISGPQKSEYSTAGEVDEIDYLSELLDDAMITSQPTVSDPANLTDPSLTASEIADEKFTIKGTLQPNPALRIFGGGWGSSGGGCGVRVEVLEDQ